MACACCLKFHNGKEISCLEAANSVQFALNYQALHIFSEFHSSLASSHSLLDPGITSCYPVAVHYASGHNSISISYASESRLALISSFRFSPKSFSKSHHRLTLHIELNS